MRSCVKTKFSSFKLTMLLDTLKKEDMLNKNLELFVDYILRQDEIIPK